MVVLYTRYAVTFEFAGIRYEAILLQKFSTGKKNKKNNKNLVSGTRVNFTRYYIETRVVF